jgi:hypothetical protein
MLIRFAVTQWNRLNVFMTDTLKELGELAVIIIQNHGRMKHGIYGLTFIPASGGLSLQVFLDFSRVL